MKQLVYLSIFLLCMACSCSSPAPQVPYNKLERPCTSEYLMEMNKEFAAIEDSIITNYIDSLHLDITTTKSGLRYYIEKPAIGPRAQLTDNVTFRYTVKQLTGESCETLTDVVKMVDLNKCDLERGFREALTLLRVSETGVFIMPSFLAYGVIGVPNCIPAWTPIECRMTLVEIVK